MNKNKHLGFTLTELLVVIAIMGIMAAVAMPSLSRFVASTRITNRAEQMANLFRFAKGEAVRLNAPVIVCGTAIRNDGRPTGECSEVDSNGWRAFADINRNGVYDSGDLDLRTISLNGANGQNKKKVSVEIGFYNISGKYEKPTESQLAFMPNGTFGRKSTKGTTTLSGVIIGDRYVSLTLTDVETSSKKNQQKRVVMISPSGTPTVCSGFDEKVVSDNKKININCGLK